MLFLLRRYSPILNLQLIVLTLGISAETIARVKQAVQELGYHPNMVASSLRHGHTNTISLILSNVTNPWYAESAIVQPVYEMGRQAMAQLADKLEGQPINCCLDFGG